MHWKIIAYANITTIDPVITPNIPSDKSLHKSIINHINMHINVHKINAFTFVSEHTDCDRISTPSIILSPLSASYSLRNVGNTVACNHYWIGCIRNTTSCGLFRSSTHVLQEHTLQGSQDRNLLFSHDAYLQIQEAFCFSCYTRFRSCRTELK